MEKNRVALFRVEPKVLSPPTLINLTSSCTPRRQRQRQRQRRATVYTYTHAPLTLHSFPTHRAAQSEINTHYLTALDDSNRMPGLHWPFVLAPLPPRRKKPVQPGFTAEELLYLEEVLAVVRPLLPYPHPC